MKRIALVLMACLILGGGCGRESMRDKAKRASNKAGQAVGEGASSFFTGVGEGIDKTVTSYDVRLSDELKALGITVTIAKRVRSDFADGKQVLAFYVLNKTPMEGVLRLRLFNDKGQEVGRSTSPILFTVDDARYVPFFLDKEVPLSIVQYVEMDLKEKGT